MEITKQINKVVLRDNILKKVIHAELYKTLQKTCSQKAAEKEKQFFNCGWIAFSMNGLKGYWNKETQLALPVQNSYESLNDKYFNEARANITDKLAELLFGKDCPKEIMKGVKASKSFKKCHWVGFDKGSYCVETGQFSDWNDEDSVQVGAVSIKSADFKKGILSQKYEILTDEAFKKSVKLLKERSVDKIDENEIDELVKILSLDREKITKEAADRVKNHFVMTEEIMNLYMEELLACDKRRADLENYDKKCLEDVNSGHWEVWTENEPAAGKGEVLVNLKKSLVARNPAADIHEDGLIGIDFGTKSTIVSKQDNKEKTTLMRVGIGQLTKAVERHHFENPTIMEFRDLVKFLEDYDTRKGRPETSIDDLCVSHTANNDLKACSVSDDFYSYFYDIKQWCGDTERNIKIIDQKGIERILPAFIHLDFGGFNPLELYAYYLGLYINNMRNGIYLDYVLSFPVTYEKAVKKKILDSFTKGIKKSLPETILNDKEIMQKFRVRQGVSEPAAYAITALQGYGFEPEENENILYSIFDFGGGTTDFDFGLWRLADDSKREEERYDYVIEHFGSEGDKYLGGENLLELMTFEVFKVNAEFLGRTKRSAKQNDGEASAGFSFSKPKECDEFPGSETLISNSQEARRNTKQLMEVLRPFWEGIIGAGKNAGKENAENEKETIAYNGYIFRNTEDCRFPIEDGALTVDLFDKDGNRRQKQKLYVQNREKNIDLNLTEILEKRIERGVQNFFHSILLAFRNESAVKSGAEGIQIFLAGNSSKSPILRKIFDKYIEKANSEEKEKIDGGYYHLFPPLGTEEALKIQKERGIGVNETDISAPTGKTGVAYGLIAGREGGKIKVISEVKADKQAKFRYNIGTAKRGKFQMKLDRNKVDYGQWVRFIDAGVEDFEIYYTSLPSAGKMSIDETGIYKKRCRLSEVDENADIYIRAVEEAPEDIEYCVSKSGEPTKDTKIVRIHLSE